MFEVSKNRNDMSSTLKVLVDIQCIIYCDFEEVGEALPGSIFKMELRKGTYILEFKIDGIAIVSKEYVMKTDNEEDLLRINLSKALSMYEREQKYLEISNTNADIQYKDGDWWIVNNDNGCELKLLYNIEDHSYSTRNTFDKVGLRAVNIGGVEVDNVAYFSIEGGKWGCINKYGEIQIPIIYDSSIYFYNDRVAKAILDGRDILINKYGEQLYTNLYDHLIGYFSINQIVCKNGKCGLIDTNGIFTIPLIYKSLERLNGSDNLFVFNVDKKYGIVDCNNNLLLPCIYDSIVSNQYVISVCRDNKWGVFNYDLEAIVPVEYEIRDIDSKYSDNKPILVCKNGCYGILNINISIPWKISNWNGELKHISEIVPCAYNALYDEYGREIDSFKDKSSPINYIFFVNKGFEKLHCYKYKFQAHENINSQTQYTAVCEMHFSCESFCKIYGTPHKEYFILENNGASTIRGGSIYLTVSCKKESIKDIVLLPDESKYILIINEQILLFEGEKLILSMNNAELCITPSEGVIYGVKQDGKYAIFTPNFSQCTNFEYDNIYKDSENIEVMKKLCGRNLYGEFSYDTVGLISFGHLRRLHFRSHYNWTEKYDITTKKEGIISLNPQSTVIPFNYDYIRFYTGKKSTVFVISKEFDSYPYRRYALMNTKLELLTDFIFQYIHESGHYGYLNEIKCNLVHDDIYAHFNLSLNNIEEFAPFLGYEHFVADEYDDYNGWISGHKESAIPFKNIRIFIDTETTGLPLNDKAAYTNLDNWPYLVQVALIIEDDNYGILAKRNIILKPDGYSIPESSARIHGISNAKAVKEGEDRKQVISFLDQALCNSDIIIGHNVSFDLNVVKAEIIRVKGIENTLFVKRKHNIIDTMNLGVNVCKIPNLSCYSSQSQSYKYPKLDELYYKLFNKHFDNQHDAMADIQATYDCYYELKRKSE